MPADRCRNTRSSVGTLKSLGCRNTRSSLPVAYSALFSLTALSMTLLVVRSRVLSQRTGRCTMPGNDARGSLPDADLIHVHVHVLLGRGRCAGGGARGGGSGGGGLTGRHAGRVIALIFYRRGRRLTFYRYYLLTPRTHGTLAIRLGAHKHDAARQHDASTIMNMSSRSRPLPSGSSCPSPADLCSHPGPGSSPGREDIAHVTSLAVYMDI